MSISRDEVRKIAELAKLEIPEQDLDRFVRQFQELLDYFDQLQSLAAEGVEPMCHALLQPQPETPFREDQIRASLGAAQALSNAPDSSDDQFRVPKVIE